MSQSYQPVITISGEKVALGPIHRGLIDINHRWINQLETTRFLEMGVTSLEAEEDWYQTVAAGKDIVYFTIYEKSSMRPIGGVNLHHINAMHRKAELGIMIGEKDQRGKGFGTEAVQLMCDFGFNALGLNSIMLLTSEWNVAGQRAYIKAGFREMGRRRDARWFAGRYWDDVYYDILASEFKSPVVRGMITEGIDLAETRSGAQSNCID